MVLQCSVYFLQYFEKSFNFPHALLIMSAIDVRAPRERGMHQDPLYTREENGEIQSVDEFIRRITEAYDALRAR